MLRGLAASSNLTIAHSHFLNTIATHLGGAVYISLDEINDFNISFDACSFNGTSTKNGAAITILGTEPTSFLGLLVQACLFDNLLGASGAGISFALSEPSEHSTIVVRDTSFRNASNLASGVVTIALSDCQACSTVIDGCMFDLLSGKNTSNVAAINSTNSKVESSSWTITNCSFTRIQGTQGPGIVFYSMPSATFTNCTVIVEQCTFSNLAATSESGGAIRFIMAYVANSAFHFQRIVARNLTAASDGAFMSFTAASMSRSLFSVRQLEARNLSCLRDGGAIHMDISDSAGNSIFEFVQSVFESIEASENGGALMYV